MYSVWEVFFPQCKHLKCTQDDSYRRKAPTNVFCVGSV
uniref:Uncharacterized protein n=1 Tax=Anguilla anguilla TaxID=7936 RepID=A0A0E9S481_ANGAN